MIILYGFLSVLIISLISLVGGILLFVGSDKLKKYIMPLVGLAVGALFGDAFLHLIPEVLENEDLISVSPIFILLGLVSFFVLERFLSWHHHHGVDDDAHDNELPIGKMILFSDALHNFIDGVVIAVSYAVSIPVGIATTIAVILHELPQEIGDFGLLIHAGYSKGKALFYNFVSSIFAIVGFVIASYLSVSESFLTLASAFAAGSFIYIAGSDLVPELKNQKITKNSIIEFAFVIIGILAMYLLLFLE
jgi:zinc and cadmium transporter